MIENTAFFKEFLDAYNQTWYDKDIEGLKGYYDFDNDRLIYFDNHAGNDTYTVKDHLSLIFDFSTQGKKTESGDVEEISIENFHAFAKEDAACLCFITKYKSFLDPYIRATMYLEKMQGDRKVVHVHCSFEPK